MKFNYTVNVKHYYELVATVKCEHVDLLKVKLNLYGLNKMSCHTPAEPINKIDNWKKTRCEID